MVMREFAREPEVTADIPRIRQRPVLEGPEARAPTDTSASTLERFSGSTLPWLLAIGVFSAAVYWWTVTERVAINAFVPLADSLLHGQLHYREAFPYLEQAVANGVGYPPYPPAPVLLVLPFVAIFGPQFDQGIAAALVGGANVALMWVMLQRLGVRWSATAWLVAAFAFGTVHWWAAGVATAWLFAHVAAVFFSLIALILAVKQERPALAGLALGLAAASRVPEGLTVPIFLFLYGVITLDGWRIHFNRERVGTIIAFLGAMAVPVLVVAAYNYARFGNPSDFGYEKVMGVLLEPQYRLGIQSVAYIPRNLYFMFVRGFDFREEFPWFRPNWGGTSLILSSPFLAWAFRAPMRNGIVAGAWVAILVALIPIVTHGGVGWTQWSYRRILDVVPFLFVLLGFAFRDGITTGGKIAVLIAIAVNAYAMWAILAINFVGW